MRYYLHDDKFAVVRGLVPGVKPVRVYGINENQGTTEESVWVGSAIYPYPTAANTLVLYSTSASDASGGTGASQITIDGLDANLVEISETITLNGTANVSSTSQFYRINSMYASNTGSLGKAAGNVSAYHTGNLVGFIDPTLGNNSQHAGFTIPKGKTGYACQMLISTSSGSDVLTHLWSRSPGATGQSAFYFLNYRGTQDLTLEFPIKLVEGTDAEVRASTLSGTSTVAAALCIVLIDDAPSIAQLTANT